MLVCLVCLKQVKAPKRAASVALTNEADSPGSSAPAAAVALPTPTPAVAPVAVVSGFCSAWAGLQLVICYDCGLQKEKRIPSTSKRARVAGEE